MRGKKQGVGKAEVLIPAKIIENRIYLIRGRRVMLDRDLAGLYGVPTKRLKEQVRRNLKRFPSDFMFELTWEETAALASRPQIATLKKGQNIKYPPYAFTEQGVAMLSSVLHSDRAIDVNIQIMRVFVRLKGLMISHKDLACKIEDLERKFKEHDRKFVLVFEAIRNLLKEPEESTKPKEPIGFRARKE